MSDFYPTAAEQRQAEQQNWEAEADRLGLTGEERDDYYPMTAELRDRLEQAVRLGESESITGHPDIARRVRQSWTNAAVANYIARREAAK